MNLVLCVDGDGVQDSTPRDLFYGASSRRVFRERVDVAQHAGAGLQAALYALSIISGQIHLSNYNP